MKPKKSNQPSALRTGEGISQEQIAERAHAIWRDRGQPGGQDLEHWLEAERELRNRGRSPGEGTGDEPSTDEVEADKRLDGLVQRPRGD